MQSESRFLFHARSATDKLMGKTAATLTPPNEYGTELNKLGTKEGIHDIKMPRHNLFTNSEMTDMVAIYTQQNFSERAAARSYADTYPNRRQPNRKLFSRLFSRLRETGSFRPSRHYSRPVVHNVQQEEVILNIVEGEPTISIRRMSANWAKD
ncbi:hypothetical protein NQ318_005185 [Aromia moschata]|uniref:DUF4817 domain-containing protein n=1 Tax=Aromia moschata TaxID=1265417 RepID=A0AAV8YCK9_9CUCU|nr:hypothetical protein NQ318_005185 [Aromia moschata]